MNAKIMFSFIIFSLAFFPLVKASFMSDINDFFGNLFSDEDDCDAACASLGFHMGRCFTEVNPPRSGCFDTKTCHYLGEMVGSKGQYSDCPDKYCVCFNQKECGDSASECDENCDYNEGCTLPDSSPEENECEIKNIICEVNKDDGTIKITADATNCKGKYVSSCGTYEDDFDDCDDHTKDHMALLTKSTYVPTSGDIYAIYACNEAHDGEKALLRFQLRNGGIDAEGSCEATCDVPESEECRFDLNQPDLVGGEGEGYIEITGYALDCDDGTFSCDPDEGDSSIIELEKMDPYDGEIDNNKDYVKCKYECKKNGLPVITLNVESSNGSYKRKFYARCGGTTGVTPCSISDENVVGTKCDCNRDGREEECDEDEYCCYVGNSLKCVNDKDDCTGQSSLAFFETKEDCENWNNPMVDPVKRCSKLYIGYNSVPSDQCSSSSRCKAILYRDKSSLKTWTDVGSGRFCKESVGFVPSGDTEHEFTLKIYKRYSNTPFLEETIDVTEDSTMGCCEEDEMCSIKEDCCGDDAKCEDNVCKKETTPTESTTPPTQPTTPPTESTTPPTVPPQILACDSEVEVGDEIKCTFTNCNEGLWIVVNKEGDPLSHPDVKDIPPLNEEFGPTVAEGIVKTRAFCTDPIDYNELIKNAEIVVKKGAEGIILTCPDECVVGAECKCKVEGCKSGIFSATNKKNEPLEKEISVVISSTPFDYNFTTKENGQVNVTVQCIDPTARKEHIINITGEETTTTPTTVPAEEKFNMVSVECEKDKCKVDVILNTMSDDVKIFINLFDEPDGTIYFKGKKTIDAGETGEIEIELDDIKNCPEGEDLKVIVLAYEKTDMNILLDRLKGDALEC